MTLCRFFVVGGLPEKCVNQCGDPFFMAGAALGFRIYVQLNSQCGRSGNSAPILECDLSSSQGEIYRCGFSDILNLCTRVGHKSLAFGNGFAIGRNGLAGLKSKIYNSCSD